MRGTRCAFVCCVLLQPHVFIRTQESFSALGFDELHVQFGRHRNGALLVGFSDAVGEGGDAALLEVLVHEGVHNGVVETIEEPDGLNNGNDHVECDSIVFFLQVI